MSWQHFRLCFAAVMMICSSCLAPGLWKVSRVSRRNKKSDIDDILDEEEVVSREAVEGGISQFWGPG